MFDHAALPDDQLFSLLRSGQIAFAGNRRLRIYGRLDCPSGRRLKRAHRVFFASEDEALREGFRPCGHCMRRAYRHWRNRHARA